MSARCGSNRDGSAGPSLHPVRNAFVWRSTVVRLLVAGLLIGGGLTLFLPDEPAPPTSDTAESPSAPDEAGDRDPEPQGEDAAPGDDPAPATPRERKRAPRSHPESDLPTRDLLLRERGRGGESSPGEKIIDALDGRLEIAAENRPLRQVLQELAQTANINLYLDEADISQSHPETRPLDQPVSCQSTEIRFEALLGRLLEPRDLAWAIRDDALWIVSKSAAETRREIRAYDVATLLKAGHRPADLLKVVRQAAHGPRQDAPRSALTGSVLLHRANQQGQRVVAGLLDEFDQIAEENAEGNKHRVAPQARGPARPPKLHTVAYLRPVADEPSKESPEEQILTALEERHDVDYHDLALTDCLAQLATLSGLTLAIDRDAITTWAKSLEPPRSSPLEDHPRVKLREARLESILNTLLEPRHLGWMVRHDTLWITVAGSIDRLLETKSYDVTNLLETGHDPQDLVEAVQDMLLEPAPPNFGSLQPRSVELSGDVLVARLTQPEHWELAQLLGELDLIAEEADQTGDTQRDLFTWESYRVPAESAEGLAKTLPEIIAPDSWLPSGRRLEGRNGGEIRHVPGMLLIRQTRSHHQEIRRLLPPN